MHIIGPLHNSFTS